MAYNLHTGLSKSMRVFIFPCAGKAGCWASPVCRCALFLRQSRTVDRGGQPAPGLPCALFHFEGEATKQSSGEMRRERAKVCLPLGMRIEARRCQPLTPSLRAQRSNPVCRRGKILDCIAALAMMMLKQLPAKIPVSCPGRCATPLGRALQRVRDTRTVPALLYMPLRSCNKTVTQ